MKIFKSFLVLCLLTITGTAFAYSHVVRLSLLEYSDFQSFENDLYISSSIPETGQQKVHELLHEARIRIADQYGQTQAQPRVVVLESAEELERFKLYDLPGTLLFAPWGNYLLLNYGDLSLDVTAHELVHAEVVERVGYLNRQLYIPSWFDEGAAMQVDRRPQYDLVKALNQAEFERVIGLDSPGKFWTRDRQQNVENYRSSKHVVAEIFEHTGADLYMMLEKVRRGDTGVIARAVTETRAQRN